MAGKSSQSNNRGADLFGFFVSGKDKQYHTAEAAIAALPPQGHTATGGVISDYTVGPVVYRAHVFTSSGTFNVTELGSLGHDVEYLLVGGGGAGGRGGGRGGGGGAGGVVYASSSPVSTSPGAYALSLIHI